MSEHVLLGTDHQITRIPQSSWERHLEGAPQHAESRLGFMTPEHQRIRYLSVQELVRTGVPIPPEKLASDLNLTLKETRKILDDLEMRLFFLVRNDDGAVEWAFPVTVQPTQHRLTFSSGEQLYAA